jgi:nonribosomal peptide synthetase DhbF
LSAHNINHPLLAAQLEVWLNEKVDPDNPIFYGGQYTEIYGAIDPTIFEAALRQVLVEAEALRVKIYEDVNGPRQIIDDSLKWSMPFIDLSKEPDPKAAAEEWMKADLGRVVDLTHGPLFSFVLFKLGPEQFIWYQWTHHIVNDGFGYWLIARRVAEVYTSKANDLPGSDGVYSSLRLVIEDEERYLASEQFERDRLYWLECLAGMSEPTSLTDKPLVKSSSFLRETAYIQSVDADMMRMTAHRTGTTLSQLTIAAVAAYLSRLTDANEVILGLTVTARLGAVSRNAPCMMANVVPLRLITLPDMSVSELIQQVGQKTRQALRHQRYRSEYLKRELGLAATDRRLFGPTVNIMPFDYNLYFADHCATTHNLSNGMVEDLSIVVYGKSKDGEMRIDFNANPNLYTLGDLQNHLRRFLRFLEAVVADADQAVGQIDLLTPEERRQILKEWNETRVAFPQTQALHHLIEAQVERTPESVAVRFDDQSLTYAEMNRRSNQLAHFLRAMGVRPETLVGICLERSPETVVTIAGILKAGAAYLPLDPSYPSERLAFMLGDARPLVLLTQERLLRDLPKFGGETVCLDRDWQLIARQSEEDLRAFGSADNLAYVIYTSGSTGQPKGAMLTHAGILNCIYWMQGEYQLNFSDRFLVKTPLNFDPSVWELFWPLWVGGTLILAEPDRHQDPAYLAQLIAERDVTSAYFVPSMLRAFLDEPGLEVCRSLKRVICGGESLSIEAVNHFFERFDAEFHHSYGPTETSIAATEWTCRRESKHLIAPIGKPLGNIQVYILDAAMQPAPIGSPGELYIGGICVGRGYLNRPDLTAERFVPDPFGNDPGGRFYRTGDLARYLSGGDIEFCGRVDNQVKLRGHRIELGEIEAALRSFPKVRETVVVARESERGEKRLVGYVVGAEDIHAGELREYLRGMLPEYMAPGVYVVLEELPLTPSGKIDRRALPVPEGRRPELEQGYVAARTSTEQILTEIWSHALGLPEVGIHDNFFDLGGHSLLLVEVLSRLRGKFKREVHIVDLFKYPTIELLATYLAPAEGEVQLQMMQTELAAKMQEGQVRRKHRLKKFLVSRQ